MILRASAVVLAALVFACSGGGGSTGSIPAPAPEGEVVGQGGLEVKAAFAAATLGDEGCGGASAAAPSANVSGDVAGRCAPAESGGFAPGSSGGTRCGGGCRPSTLQISFTTGANGAAAKVQITSVTLNDDATGAEVAKLTASNAQLWDAASSTYKAWDGSLSPAANAKASYTLTTPALERSFEKKYRLEVTLVIDGQTIVLESDVLAREPDVAT